MIFLIQRYLQLKWLHLNCNLKTHSISLIVFILTELTLIIDHLCSCPYCGSDQCVLLEIYSFLAGHLEEDKYSSELKLTRKESDELQTEEIKIEEIAVEPIRIPQGAEEEVENDPAAQFRLELIPSNNNGVKTPLEEKLEKDYRDLNIENNNNNDDQNAGMDVDVKFEFEDIIEKVVGNKFNTMID